MSASVLLVNWNGWADTLECLESLLRLDPPARRVVVCDNGSSDGSVERLRAWADGRLDVAVPPGHPLRARSFPPVVKPVACVELDRDTAERGGRGEDAGARVVLIRTGGNLGFGGGANVGLRYLLARGDADHVWLLNNDTVVRSDALGALLRRMRASPEIGICGSTLVDYADAEIVQAMGGGVYNRWLGVTRHLGEHRRLADVSTAPPVEEAMSYVVGASMLVSRRFLETIGLIAEEYFLYFEEVDWAIRGHPPFALGYAPDSIVYHKGGAATAGGWKTARTSLLADYFNFRGRLLLTRRYYPLALPTVYLGLVVSLLIRWWRGYRDRLGMTVKLALRCGGGRIDIPDRAPGRH